MYSLLVVKSRRVYSLARFLKMKKERFFLFCHHLRIDPPRSLLRQAMEHDATNMQNLTCSCFKMSEFCSAKLATGTSTPATEPT